MSNAKKSKFDGDYIDDDIDVYPPTEKKTTQKEAPAGHAKLPDISDAIKVFKKNESTTSGTTNPVERVGHQQKARTSNNENIGVQQTRSQNSSFIADERSVDGPQEKNEDAQEDIKENPDGREIVVKLSEVLVDPSKNVSRGGKAWKKTDPEVIALAMTIKRSKLINAPEIRPLKDPIEKPDGTFYRFELVSGYKRFAALEYIGYVEHRFVLFDGLDDDEALIHNGLENWGRSDPTEFDLAIYCSVVARKKGWSAEHIARRIKAKTSRIETLLLIVERCPTELLETFRLTPTPEIRRDLARVSLIQRPTIEETHKAMLEEWMRIQNDKNRVDNTSTVNNPNSNTRPVRNNRNVPGDSKITRLRNEYAQYSEWFDSSTNTYRPITEEMREFGEQIFRYLQRSKGENPFR